MNLSIRLDGLDWLIAYIQEGLAGINAWFQDENNLDDLDAARDRLEEALARLGIEPPARPVVRDDDGAQESWLPESVSRLLESTPGVEAIDQVPTSCTFRIGREVTTDDCLGEEYGVVWLAPQEARFVFDRLDDDVERDDSFTDPDQIATAIRIARKMVPAFDKPPSSGWGLLAAAILSSMESVRRATVEQAGDLDHGTK